MYDEDEEWFSTKKRGRDDQQIQKDQQKAKLIRKQQRLNGNSRSIKVGGSQHGSVSTLITSTGTGKKKNSTKSAHNHKKKNGQNKKRKSNNDYEDDDDDDDDDDDSFIVDDDIVDELDEDDEESFVEEDDDDDDDDDDIVDDEEDDDDDELRRKHPSTKYAKQASVVSKTSMKYRRNEGTDDEKDNDSSSSSADDGFFSKYTKKRVSKAMPLPSLQLRQQEKQALKKQSNISSTLMKNNKIKNNPFSSFAHSKMKKPPPIQVATKISNKSNTINVVSLENSDSDSNINNKQDQDTKAVPKYNLVHAKNDDSDHDSMMSESKLFEVDNKNAPGTTLTDHELEDTPLLQQAIRKKHKTKKLKTYSIDSSSDDDDDDDVDDKKHKKKSVVTISNTTTVNINDDDYCSDIDEAIAIAYAIEKSSAKPIGKSASTATTIIPKKKVTKMKEINKKPKTETIYLEDSSSDDEDDEKNEARNEEVSADYVQINDDDDENENNEDARVAKSILETANLLSMQILQTMSSWTHGATDGMIVDGALALSTIRNTSNASNLDSKPSSVERNHTWISNETMIQILPNVKLSEYQLIGINWIALLHNMKCEVVTEGAACTTKSKKKQQYTNVNGILADEMGLGKTCQTIAFLSWLKRSNEDTNTECRPHLVIAPASVVSNWEIEFKKFAPHLNVVKYHGTMNERLDIQSELKEYLPNGDSNKKKNTLRTPLDVIIAPVTYFQQEKSDDRYFLKKFQYDYMIVDEAHLLKNSRGMRYKSLDRFKTMHRLLLTGTPVQNSPKELMSLLCFLMPLFSRKNSDEFDDTQGHDGGESMLQYFVSIQEDNDDIAAYRKLKQLFSPFVLRRRKVDVLSQILPPKVQQVEFVELDEESRIRYNSIIAEHVENKKLGSAAYEHLFTQLRKAAHHPLMLRSRYVTPKEKEHLNNWFYQYGAFRGEGCTKVKVAEEIEKFTDFDIHLTASELIEENPLRRAELDRYVLNEQDLFCSAKFVRLREILPELISKGHRILIFSVWTTCLDLLGCLLEQMGLEFLRMDGQTAVSDRQSLIDQFNKNTWIPVFLLSTKACGLGLNLTSADTCIQHDLDFNPFNDLQAEDRCHRIGQTKTVKIIKMVSKDTVDEDIYRMQQRKAKMNAAIMDNDTSNTSKKSSANNDQKQVLEIAVNRYLQSPTAVTSNKNRKSDTKNSVATTTSTTGLAKENVPNVECIEIL